MLSLTFGFYASRFANYGATYGSIAGVIALLTLTYLSSYIFLFGAELNSEFEHQTAKDTTTGTAQPLGARGAWSADHVADGAHDEDKCGDTLDPKTPRMPTVELRTRRAGVAHISSHALPTALRALPAERRSEWRHQRYRRSGWGFCVAKVKRRPGRR